MTSNSSASSLFGNATSQSQDATKQPDAQNGTAQSLGFSFNGSASKVNKVAEKASGTLFASLNDPN